ncbi:MAG: DUF5010 domain-containing protein, partial [Phycisphaerae bacterium]|nr:DUF5010 domain-containing protein [Phycisphaerae bacterium]
HHPPATAMPDFSYKSVDWHYSQLRDMRDAGIDFLLPVTASLSQDDASSIGLSKLVQAHDRLLAEQKLAEQKLTEQRLDATRTAPPASSAGQASVPVALPTVLPTIGMFYDMNARYADARYADITTADGREQFYATIRNFFRIIPPNKWARMDGQPIVFLSAIESAAESAKKVDDPQWLEQLLLETQQRFKSDFGTTLFFVREERWPISPTAAPSIAATYGWGGCRGLTIGDAVAALGPGYEPTPTAMPSRSSTGTSVSQQNSTASRQNNSVSRQNGSFYSQQWERLLRMRPSHRPWIVHLETWNDYRDGSDIARSQEYGDQYIWATAQFARLFHARTHLDPQGPFLHADQVRWSGRQIQGIELLPSSGNDSGNNGSNGNSNGDGSWQLNIIDELPAVTSVMNEPSSSNAPNQETTNELTVHDRPAAAYLYFCVDDSYLYDEQNRMIELAVVFRDDGGCEQFCVEYDSNDATLDRLASAFHPTDPIRVGSTGSWRTTRMILSDVRFVGRTNQADFRLCITGGKNRLTIREVMVRKLPGTKMNVLTGQP